MLKTQFIFGFCWTSFVSPTYYELLTGTFAIVLVEFGHLVNLIEFIAKWPLQRPTRNDFVTNN
ncbi:MAG: hypothetical protein DRR16_07205 [Candidatus Parabeggiatoa sp. nov. 3]|nr:MAG: hypothetical protein DRR16_07205 [Gammaproteobacteria bacterium]